MSELQSIDDILIAFPIAVTVHVLRNCVIITGFFFIGTTTKRVKWCEENSLPSSLAFLSNWNESVLWDGLDAERTAPVKKYTLSNLKESECAPSTQAQLLFHESVLELIGSKPRNCWNPHSTRTSSCCFFDEYFEANVFLRNLVLHFMRTLSAVMALSFPNAALRQVVSHLDRNDAPPS